MLSRGSSDAGTRLRRAKSASSVQQRRAQPLVVEPIDPHTAKVHALVAAHRAMGRSSERASEELRRADSNASKNTHRTDPSSPPIPFHVLTELRNQRPLFQSRTSNIASTLRIPDMTTLSDEHASSYGTAENYGAEPSSYRRLRKARSMLTPTKQVISPAPPPYRTPISTGTTPTLRKAKSTMGTDGSGLRLGLKKSVSFLRQRARSLQRPQTEMAHREEAVAMAREQFLQNQANQQVSPRPVSSLRLKTKRLRMGFPKTVRTNRETELGDGVKSANQPLHEPRQESKIRNISSSLRDRVRKAFGRSVVIKDDLGAQQVEASRLHLGDCVDGSDDAGFNTYYLDGLEPPPRGSIYVPTKQSEENAEELDKFPSTIHSTASRDSLHSNSRSRVTSWTNSTATASLAGRSTPLEPKRLSIIKEDGGPHQPSSSAGRHIGGVLSFAEPLRRQDSRGQPIPVPDSQRIYSALVRRMDAEKAEMESTKAQLSAIHQEEIVNNGTALYGNPTVRAVQSAASLQTFAPDHVHRDISMSSEALREQGMTPLQLARHAAKRQKCSANLIAQDAQSSFFPFSIEEKPKAPSPYKLAMTAQREQQMTNLEDSAAKSEHGGSVIVHHRPTIARELQYKLGSSESIYSRTTNGGSNSLYQSPLASPEQSSDNLAGMSGMATIIPTRINRYPRPSASLGQMNRMRSTDKGDWKGWIEKQMSSLDRQVSKVSTASSQSHLREKAQTSGDNNSMRSYVGSRLGFGQRNLNDTTPSAASKSNVTRKNRYSQLELREVSGNITPVRKSSDSMNRSWPDVLNTRVSVEKNDENRKLGARAVDSLRKISPRNISNLLTEKKSQIFGRKENSKAGSESPPVSTPGRIRMQVSKTRKNVTPNTSPGPGLFEVLPSSNGVRVIQDKKYAFEDLDDTKKDLSRLSRPFDMTVPEHNRPFDSIYLGKDDIGAQTGLGPDRLSVAPRVVVDEKSNKSAEFWERMGTMGEGTEEGQQSSPYSDTALPRIVSGQGASGSTSKFAKSMGSSRLVSNFLKSRRRNMATSRSTTEESTAAFV